MAVQTKLQVRRDTAANWTTTNPTLASGELGFETDTLKFKIGNGSTLWNSLVYQNASTSAQNYAQTTGTKTLVTTGATFPYTVVSVTITTSGNPVLVMVSGDAENVTAGGWGRAQLYRGTTALGNDIQFEGSAGSENSPYAMQYVDAPAAGTYTYNFKIVSVTGSNFNFGENTGPVITAIELNSLAGSANLASNLANGAAGLLPYQTGANATTFLARTATNNSTLAFNSSTNAPFWIQPTLSNTYYAATTSAQLAGVISDKTGSGNLVFGTTPTITPANAVATTAASQAGYIGMPQISVSANTAILATHAGKHIYTTVTGLTHTIPANSNVAFEIGTTLTFITPASVSLSIAITTDTMYLAGTGTTGTRTLAAYGMATAVKITSTSWIISGNGLT